MSHIVSQDESLIIDTEKLSLYSIKDDSKTTLESCDNPSTASTIPSQHDLLSHASTKSFAKKPSTNQHDALKRIDADGLSRECEAYSQHINTLMTPYANQLGRYLPVQKETIFSVLQDGVLLAYMIYAIRPQCIELKQIKLDLNLSQLNQPQSKAIFEVTNNHNIVLKAAKATGIKIVNIGSEDILSMHPTLMLGLIWQLVRLFFLDQVNIQTHPELIKLAHQDESIVDLMQLSSETILLRWVNFHLSRANAPRQIQNLGKDLSDSVAYAFLLFQILPRDSILPSIMENIISPLEHGEELSIDLLERAQFVLDQIKHVNIETFVTAQDISNGHSRLNLCLVAELFNRFVGIQMMTEGQVKDLAQERDGLQIKISQMENEISKLRSGLDDEKQAWEHIVVEERQMYSQRLEELRGYYEEQLSEFKERYLMETEGLNRKISQQKNVFENTVEELIQGVSVMVSQTGQLLRSMSTVASIQRAKQPGNDTFKNNSEHSISENEAASAPESPRSYVSLDMKRSQSLRSATQYNTDMNDDGDDNVMLSSYQRGSAKHLCDLVRKANRHVSTMSQAYGHISTYLTTLQQDLHRMENINHEMDRKIVEYAENLVGKKSSNKKKSNNGISKI